MTPLFWINRYKKEISQAKIARHSENEGKARVCARRAASILAEEYLHRRGISLQTINIIERLTYIKNLPDLPPHTQAVVEYFLLHVNDNKELPINVDLIAEAEWLRLVLLDEI